MLTGNDFLLEEKLYKEGGNLHTVFKDNVFALQSILNNYQTWFPTFTDHSALHAGQVINFCNNLIGQDNIKRLNVDEVFALLMGCYLHDSGMGVSKADFHEFKDKIDLNGAITEGENVDYANIIRKNHHEFAGQFVKKYAPFFEIPTPEHLFAIVQISRGHRKTDLMDPIEYPTDLKLENGNVINLAYLSVLIRLADEIDIAIDRNPYELYQDYSKYSEKDIHEFNLHKSIKHLDVLEDHFVLYAHNEDPLFREEIVKLVEKIKETLDYSLKVLNERTTYDIKQKYIELVFE